MTEAEIRAHVAKLSPSARARVPVSWDAIFRTQSKQPRGAPSWAPYASKWEWVYAQQLAVWQLAQIITEWVYEPDTLEAAGGTQYTPDFRVTYPDGRTEYHEIKGYLRAKDAVRMRECAAVSPYPIIVLSHKGGSWHETRRYQGMQP